jgi:hypothetical protein
LDNDWVSGALQLAPGGGLVGLVTLAVLAVWRGWLVPRGTLDLLNASAAREIQGYRERLDDSKIRENEWKAAYGASEEARRVQAGQLAELLELAKATDAVLRALPRGGGEPR